MGNNRILDVRNLSVDFRIDRKSNLQAVRNVSFFIQEGETLGILGESGCGKSVTCMSILKLNPQRSTTYPTGEILYNGEDLLKMTEKQLQHVRGQDISMIFQEPMTALDPLFTIGDQLMECIRIHDDTISKADAEEMVLEAIKSVKIPNPQQVFESYPFTLSGGMLQRCMIAMAMLSHPKILICDEPTTALDVTIQAQVLDLMNELKEKNNMSILFVTHDLGVISEIADRVMVMYGGKKCEEGTVVDVFLHPKHPYTIGLIGSHLTPDYNGRRLPVIEGSVPPLKDMPMGCPFHNRCPRVTDRCASESPVETDFGNGHRVACFALQEGEEELR